METRNEAQAYSKIIHDIKRPLVNAYTLSLGIDNIKKKELRSLFLFLKKLTQEEATKITILLNSSKYPPLHSMLSDALASYSHITSFLTEISDYETDEKSIHINALYKKYNDLFRLDLCQLKEKSDALSLRV